jgi:tRNA-specific 2-thiouridylase
MNFDLQKGDLVAVAMSGGVDSSVAAALAVEAGFQVIGITLQLYDYGAMGNKKGACCAGQDIYDARTVADRMGFPHYVFDYESIFKQSVIEDFADSYMRGETPIPCIRCNQKVKFRDLLTSSQQLGAKALITGHYVQRIHGHDRVELHRGNDPKRDQSYFLFTTSQSQLDYLRFPLGHQSKDETRADAKRFGLNVADKPDSQDICFVPSGGYASVVEKLRPEAFEKGTIIDKNGTVLGEHNGIINFTVGQRKGLNISHTEPLFVISINADRRQVVAGPKEDLAQTTLTIKETNWLVDQTQPLNNVTVKIRSSQDPIPATLQPLDNGMTNVQLHGPEYGISKGQACVFYDDMRVLGGGWIC